MPQIDIPEQLHNVITQFATAIDATPEHLISRLLFGGIKKMPLHPTQLALIKAAIDHQGKAPAVAT